MENLTGVAEFKPEMRFTNNGKQLCTIYITRGDESLKAVAWGDLAEDIVDDTFYDQIIPGTTVLSLHGYWKTRQYRGKDYREFTCTRMPQIIP